MLLDALEEHVLGAAAVHALVEARGSRAASGRCGRGRAVSVEVFTEYSTTIWSDSLASVYSRWCASEVKISLSCVADEVGGAVVLSRGSAWRRSGR